MKFKDVYFSQKAFQFNMDFDGFYNVAEINGEEVPYTEIITVGNKPLSKHGDLVYLGISNKFKHVKLK